MGFILTAMITAAAVLLLVLAYCLCRISGLSKDTEAEDEEQRGWLEERRRKRGRKQ